MIQFSHLQDKHKTKMELIDCKGLRTVPAAHFKGKHKPCVSKVNLSPASVMAAVSPMQRLSIWRDPTHNPEAIPRASVHATSQNISNKSFCFYSALNRLYFGNAETVYLFYVDAQYMTLWFKILEFSNAF